MFTTTKKSSTKSIILHLFAVVLFLCTASNLQAQNRPTTTFKNLYNTSKALNQLKAIFPPSIAATSKEIPVLLPSTFVSKKSSQKITIHPQKGNHSQQANVEITVPHTSKVWLSLYSAKGQKIAILLEGESIKGGVLQQVPLNDIELHEETYLFQIETEEETIWSDWWHL